MFDYATDAFEWEFLSVLWNYIMYFRHAQDVREHYERKLERANNLYMELTACMLQLEKRERELMKYVYSFHRL